MIKPITAGELLPDNENCAKINNAEIRKGTIGACLYNAALLTQKITEKEEIDLLASFAEAAKILNKTFEWNRHLTWNNPAIQAIFLQAMKK